MWLESEKTVGMVCAGAREPNEYKKKISLFDLVDHRIDTETEVLCMLMHVVDKHATSENEERRTEKR